MALEYEIHLLFFLAYFLGSFSSAGNFWLDAAGHKCNLPNQRDADFLSASIMDTLAFLESENPLCASEN